MLDLLYKFFIGLIPVILHFPLKQRVLTTIRARLTVTSSTAALVAYHQTAVK
jgi:hypothetical protein